MKMILFVLHDATKVYDLLNAWKEAGASGATRFSAPGWGGSFETILCVTIYR